MDAYCSPLDLKINESQIIKQTKILCNSTCKTDLITLHLVSNSPIEHHELPYYPQRSEIMVIA